MKQILVPSSIFDGTAIIENRAIVVEDGAISGVIAASDLADAQVTRLDGMLAPGLVDLQVNGGGGVMLDGAANGARLTQIVEAHARLGATTILPTLITDTPAATRSAIKAAVAFDGLAGLHLEGPHLDPRRAGAHDPALIRPMTADDLALYLEAAKSLTLLKITFAPANVTLDQVQQLAQAGVLMSLGHADCSYEDAQDYVAAGARMVTHLYNAMSQIGSRAPGLVGAALDLPIHAGLIADGVHVHRASAMAALRASDRVFLVSDAMAVSGSNLAEFDLQGRKILRSDGRLTLCDGTLAGADLTLPQAIANVVSWGILPARALAMATRIPADVIGRRDLGRIAMGARADFVLFAPDWTVRSVWRAGHLI